MTRGSSIRLYCSALAVGVLLTTALGQTSATAGKVKVRELTIEQQNAAGVLDSLTDQAKSVSDTAMRIRVEARLADALVGARSRTIEAPFPSRLRGDRRPQRVADRPDCGAGRRSVGALRRALCVALSYGSRVCRRDGSWSRRRSGSIRRRRVTLREPLRSERNAPQGRDVSRAAQSNTRGRARRQACSLAFLWNSARFSMRFPRAPRRSRIRSRAMRFSRRSNTARVRSTFGAWDRSSFRSSRMVRRTVASGGGAADTKRRFLEAAYAVTGRYVSTLSDHTIAPAPGDSVDPASVFTGQGLMLSYSLARQIAPLFDAYDPERSAAFRVLVGQIEGSPLPTFATASVRRRRRSSRRTTWPLERRSPRCERTSFVVRTCGFRGDAARRLSRGKGVRFQDRRR